jgi:hypothetical protein
MRLVLNTALIAETRFEWSVANRGMTGRWRSVLSLKNEINVRAYHAYIFGCIRGCPSEHGGRFLFHRNLNPKVPSGVRTVGKHRQRIQNASRNNKIRGFPQRAPRLVSASVSQHQPVSTPNTSASNQQQSPTTITRSSGRQAVSGVGALKTTTSWY